MGKYLDILARAEACDKSDQSDQSCCVLRTPFGRFNRFRRTLSALEARCPDLVPVGRWQVAVEDGRRFLARWGEQAEALGWTARDLFGLHQPPAPPHPSYQNSVGRIKTEKSGFTVTAVVPVLPILAETLAAGPCGDLTFIVGERGQPLTKESFGNAFREACRAAGVPGSAHGVRKIAATTAANNGARLHSSRRSLDGQAMRCPRSTPELQTASKLHHRRHSTSRGRPPNGSYG